MHSSLEMKQFTVADFAKHAELAGQTLTGFIRFDPSSPDVIYYGVSSEVCPQHPIPKGSIENLQVSSGEIPCYGVSTGVMFFARVVLKADAPGAGGLTKLAASLANEARAAVGLSDERQARPLVVKVLRTGYYILVFPLMGGHFFYVGPYATYQIANAARASYQPPHYNANPPIYLRAGDNFPGE